jgi:hypothetical protein
VNGTTVPILEATRQENGESARYRIAPEMRSNDAVTWAYDAATGTIQNLDGDNMLSVGPKEVVASR